MTFPLWSQCHKVMIPIPHVVTGTYSCDSVTGKADEQAVGIVNSWLLFWPQSEVQSSDSFIEEHVSVGRQHLVQASFAYWIVGHPKPLGAEGWRTARWGRAAPVRYEMSWVHVTVVNQHSRELEKVLCGAERKETPIRRYLQMVFSWSSKMEICWLNP